MGNEILQHFQTQINDGVDIYNGNTTSSIPAQLRLAVKNHRRARADSFRDRQAMLATHAENKVKEDNPIKKVKKIQKIILSMKHTESRLHMFNTMRNYMKSSHSSTLTHVNVPDEAQVWIWLMQI
eukprot:3683101-Ditylum_brightwellii.AAC.1